MTEKRWTLCLALAAAACSSPVEKTAPPPFAFGECRDQSLVEFEKVTLRSLYVPMRDGVRIALDLVLPENLPEGRKVPTILIMTRYWRSREGDGPTDQQVYFARRGYAVVAGDSRGTGASFGIWPYHRTPDEVRDFGEIAEWIVSQPWSSGVVGGFGLSYSANTADWMAQVNHPAVKAIVPRFPDFDPYADLYFPGGIFHVAFGRDWGRDVKEMDLNVKRGESSSRRETGGRGQGRRSPPGGHRREARRPRSLRGLEPDHVSRRRPGRLGRRFHARLEHPHTHR